MTRTCVRMIRSLLVGLVMLPVFGCEIVTDLFNPALVRQLGIGGSQGVTIVAFNNETQYPATMYAYFSTSAADLTSGAKNFSAQVAGGEVVNEVLECPVGRIGPGELSDAEGGVNTRAATVTTDAGRVDVLFEGPAVVSPAISCGDVVEIRLIETGIALDQEGAFRVVVKVIPS